MFQTLFQGIKALHNFLEIDRSIAKKINWGYTIALGTAVIGTSGGLLGGHYYAHPFQIQTQKMLEKRQLITDVNIRLLSIQRHPQRLLAIAGQSSIWVQYEQEQFTTELKQLRQLLDHIEQLAEQSDPVNVQAIALVNDYRAILLSYQDFIQTIWSKIKNIHDKRMSTEILADILSQENAVRLSTTFEKLSEDLTRQQQVIEQNYNQATIQLQEVERLQLTLIFTSMAVSIGLAIALAMITSRAIARPIEQLTKVARQITQDNNFTLQAPLTTRDEVFLLAQALNQLVSWAGQYTEELEEARQTLEKRVEERTEALQQSEASLRLKAEDLQCALNELQQTQLQLIQSEKMSSLGQMVAGIAHEINNPVSFIYGNLKYLSEYIEEVLEIIEVYQKVYPYPQSEIETVMENIDLPFLKEDFPSLIQSMQNGTTRIRDIVQSLRIFSRLDESAIKQVDIHEGMDSALIILNSRLKANPEFSSIQVVCNYEQLPKIECYAGQLNQVFMNILSNAIDALEITPNIVDPTITITTQTLGLDWVLIQISDNALGIEKDVRPRLFDPFFTTKGVGKGTGLGLSISYQIVTEKHKGSLECESTLGQGSKFSIKLPVKLSDRPSKLTEEQYDFTG